MIAAARLIAIGRHLAHADVMAINNYCSVLRRLPPTDLDLRKASHLAFSVLSKVSITVVFCKTVTVIICQCSSVFSFICK